MNLRSDRNVLPDARRDGEARAGLAANWELDRFALCRILRSEDDLLCSGWRVSISQHPCQ